MTALQGGRLAIVTICSNNYAPRARVLLASARRHHPDADLFLCVADRVAASGIVGDTGAHLILMDELAIPEPAEFAFRYDILELNTAVKPYALLHLLWERDYRLVLYFDADIEIFAPLTGVVRALEDGASVVLTPHLCHPATAAEEQQLMRAGIYNLGFFAAARCDEAEALLRWWAARLRYDCVNDPTRGLFVDQKYLDFAPAFAPHARTDHDPALNVAYWNLRQRDLQFDGDTWWVNGRRLCFFHFSGFDPARRDRLSVHSADFHAPLDAALRALIEHYAAAVFAAGHGSQPHDRYGFGQFASGVPIHDLLRRMFRERHHAWPEDPFVSFEAMLHLPDPDATLLGAPYVVSNLVRWMLDSAPWLTGRFDLRRPEDVRAVVLWFLRHARRDFGLDPRLVAPQAALVADRTPARQAPARDSSARDDGHADVSVIGYLRAVSGVGEAGRRTLRSIVGLPGLRAEGMDVALNVVCRRDDESCAPWLRDRASGRVQIFHVNADQLAEVTQHLEDRVAADAYRICVPFWELMEIPDAWVPVLESVDEIWASSRFVQTMLAGRISRPIHYMPPALPAPAAGGATRLQFGLPTQRFLFFYAFDVLSYPARKNPAAAIAAFRIAFAPGDKSVGLVIKLLNGGHHEADTDGLRAAVAADGRIVLIDRDLARSEMTDLTAACDCVLSLHRSEGFGLLIAEAMLLHRPVIATDYGASVELLTPSTGFPVGCRMIAVRPGEYPHAEGQVWADPDIAHAAWQMRLVRADPELCAAKIAAAHVLVTERHGAAPVAARQRQRLSEIGVAAV